ncbi:hypothetical protein ACUSIJ_24530 [Pseudochelatococcus sp. B33]
MKMILPLRRATILRAIPLGELDGAKDVDIELPPDVLIRNIDDCAAFDNAGAVGEHIDIP